MSEDGKVEHDAEPICRAPVPEKPYKPLTNKEFEKVVALEEAVFADLRGKQK